MVKEKMMWVFTDNKSMKKKWNHTKMKVTHKKIDNLRNNKDILLKEEKEISKNKFRMKVMTSLMINSIISDKFSSRTKLKMKLTTNKKLICKSKYKNWSRRLSQRKIGCFKEKSKLHKGQLTVC